jgi:hypothetical protein
VQFYQKGVVTNQACYEGSSDDGMYSTIATTGYTRVGVKLENHGVGQQISKPFWQVRWAYGPNYGVFGSMWIEKWNGSYD